jgi:type VI secretion system protein ImpA
MQELETVLQGKPETQFSQAEEPRWDDVRNRCVELLRRSKNLRVAVILCISLLRTEGLAGFRDGLTVIRGLLQHYWESLYPRLDPEDNNDPTERVNILASMVTPLGSFGDPMQFLKRLREAKLTDSVRAGRFSLEEIAPSGAPGAEGVLPPADSAQVQAAFRDTGAEKLGKTVTALAESTAEAKAIDDFLTTTIGAGKAPDWGPLLVTFSDIRKALAPFVSTAEAGGVDATSTAPAGSEAAGAARVPGAIQSRQDVVQTLDRICDYYAHAEPSSPVPLLLRRAQRLAEMNFLQIIGDLSPEALAPVQNVTGTKPPAPPTEAS